MGDRLQMCCCQHAADAVDIGVYANIMPSRRSRVHRPPSQTRQEVKYAEIDHLRHQAQLNQR